MTFHFSLSWVVGVGAGATGGNRKYESWAEVEALLQAIRLHGGTVSLSIIDSQTVGADQLQVAAEHGKFLLSLAEDDGDDYWVRSYTNHETVGGRTEILGDLWDSRMICRDFETICKAFREFVETGNVSRDLLD